VDTCVRQLKNSACITPHPCTPHLRTPQVCTRVADYPPMCLSHHFHSMLKEVGLWPFKARLVRELSGGMKRRLSLGVALTGDSRFIVVDEPTTGLDPASRRALWRILARARHGRAVLLTTHDMQEAETLANRIAIMTHGRLRCLGSQQVRIEAQVPPFFLLFFSPFLLCCACFSGMTGRAVC